MALLVRHRECADSVRTSPSSAGRYLRWPSAASRRQFNARPGTGTGAVPHSLLFTSQGSKEEPYKCGLESRRIRNQIDLFLLSASCWPAQGLKAGPCMSGLEKKQEHFTSGALSLHSQLEAWSLLLTMPLLWLLEKTKKELGSLEHDGRPSMSSNHESTIGCTPRRCQNDFKDCIGRLRQSHRTLIFWGRGSKRKSFWLQGSNCKSQAIKIFWIHSKNTPSHTAAFPSDYDD
jgi:hypothetical protein